MSTTENKIAVKVEASAFKKTQGDQVAKGELLGYYAGDPVEAPFNATVEGVSFDPEDHALTVVLTKQTQGKFNWQERTNKNTSARQFAEKTVLINCCQLQ